MCLFGVGWLGFLKGARGTGPAVEDGGGRGEISNGSMGKLNPLVLLSACVTWLGFLKGAREQQQWKEETGEGFFLLFSTGSLRKKQTKIPLCWPLLSPPASGSRLMVTG